MRESVQDASLQEEDGLNEVLCHPNLECKGFVRLRLDYGFCGSQSREIGEIILGIR